MKRRAFIAVLLSVAGNGIKAGGKSMEEKTCTVNLPHHLLTFSVPQEMARKMAPGQINSSYEEGQAFEKGFEILSTGMADFNGPFWIGALGSLSFHTFLQQRSPQYQGEISTAAGLKEYIGWWVPLVRRGVIGFGIVTLNGVDAVSRGTGSWQEVISFPLDETMFVEFGLRIVPVAGKPTDRWGKKAEQMRDAIRGSLTLKPKNSGS